ncbi:glycosyltransferase family 4 protein [Cyanobacterium stanieri LEGE 03274]|uniref:Glycosyltransferase family 4 protein n=1 Tax=Cyanobacterium stanieri LEGE 03274 TaxID=1828756 RepID=A0ABR9V7G0_9CHRO|nr:glycosyltransferase family 1 protein [Cyanobacterium stanieri]MBE9223464.1 glycosyltransferase family 4 protein [Cyanobacterium stanieri LEGE 03274]
MLIEKPTGISNYINHIFPYLKDLNYVSIANENLIKNLINSSEYSYNISDKFSPDYGSKGHFLRLLWTQFKLPKIYEILEGNLLFSPVPELPLFSSKVSAVVMVHDLIPIRFPQRKSALSAYFRYYVPLVCNQARHIICNSESTANDIIDYYGISAKKISPIYLGYASDKFKVIDYKKSVNKIPYFVYLGRHDPHKNLVNIISAFAKFKYCQNYELCLVGSEDARYTPLLKKLAHDLGIFERVKFLSYLNQQGLVRVLNQAEGLIFATLWEGFGFPVLEGMACGTPVITSNVSSLPEVAGDCALLVNPYDVDDIAEAMNEIVKDNVRSHLIESGLKRVKQFSWDKTGKETLEVIKQFL